MSVDAFCTEWSASADGGIEDLGPSLSPIGENFATFITPPHVISPLIPTFKP